MKILAFAASLRKDSFNRKMIRIAADYLRGQVGVTVDLADFREFEVPMYDGDVEDSSGIPTGGKELIKRLQACDAYVISTPEYNGGIPGTLKNAIDWASRAKPMPFEDKPLLLLSASPGALGGVRGLWHSRVPFEVMGSCVYPEMFGLSKAGQAFDAGGRFADSKNQERLVTLLNDFLIFSKKLLSQN